MLLLHISEENILLLTSLHLFDSFKAQNTSFYVPILHTVEHASLSKVHVFGYLMDFVFKFQVTCTYAVVRAPKTGLRVDVRQPSWWRNLHHVDSAWTVAKLVQPKYTLGFSYCCDHRAARSQSVATLFFNSSAYTNESYHNCTKSTDLSKLKQNRISKNSPKEWSNWWGTNL